MKPATLHARSVVQPPCQIASDLHVSDDFRPPKHFRSARTPNPGGLASDEEASECARYLRVEYKRYELWCGTKRLMKGTAVLDTVPFDYSGDRVKC